jgi:hypothetical protein
MNIFMGIFVILHGLVHFWFVTLSQGWVEFQADMGWTGESWLLSGILKGDLIRGLASLLYGLGAVTFLVAGAGLLSRHDWSRPWLIAASLISAFSIVVFWDGNFDLLVQKGLLGLLISLGLLAAVLLFNWPA